MGKSTFGFGMDEVIFLSTTSSLAHSHNASSWQTVCVSHFLVGSSLHFRTPFNHSAPSNVGMGAVGASSVRAKRLNESRMDDLPARLRHLPFSSFVECHDQVSVDTSLPLAFLLVFLATFGSGEPASSLPTSFLMCRSSSFSSVLSKKEVRLIGMQSLGLA